MLAMVVNDNAGCLNANVDWTSIASMLAPTGGTHFPVGRLRPPQPFTKPSSNGSPSDMCKS
ncbi:hypothetical protein DKY63_12355 [Pseudomonas putida]|uniref:Uncharacterized protein n=1 Tax=Pseudomonas putida TaxID=303 RepID=A0A2Z4RIY1_PSEPU|nr:hypothetical protein DKY63_12355 [Pseudomonas putida]